MHGYIPRLPVSMTQRNRGDTERLGPQSVEVSTTQTILLNLSVVVFEGCICSVVSPRSWESVALAKEEH